MASWQLIACVGVGVHAIVPVWMGVWMHACVRAWVHGRVCEYIVIEAAGRRGGLLQTSGHRQPAHPPQACLERPSLGPTPSSRHVPTANGGWEGGG